MDRGEVVDELKMQLRGLGARSKGERGRERVEQERGMSTGNWRDLAREGDGKEQLVKPVKRAHFRSRQEDCSGY